MTTARLIWADILGGLIMLSILLGILILPIAQWHGDPDWLMQILPLLAVPFLVNIVLRRSLKIFLLMAVAHLIIPGLAYLFLPDLFIFVLLLAGISIFQWFGLHDKKVKTLGALERHQIQSFLAACVFIAGLFAFIAFMSEMFAHTRPPFIVTALFRLFYFFNVDSPFITRIVYPVLIGIILVGGILYAHITRMDFTLEAVTLDSKQPVKRILRFDYRLMLVLLAVMLGSMFFLRVTVLDRTMAIVYDFRFPEQTFQLRDRTPVYEPAEDGRYWGDGITIQDIGEQRGHGSIQFLYILSRLLIPVGIAMMIVVLAMVIVGLGSRLFMREGRGIFRERPPLSDDEDERIFIVPPQRRTQMEALIDAVRRPEHPTRRRFRKKILQHKKTGVVFTPADTPSQMANRVTAEDISKLVEEYQAVRYGYDE